MSVDLRAERLNRGLTLSAAAEQMGLASARALQRVEAGETTPYPQNALKIASFYGYKVTDIWPVEPREPQEQAA